MSQGRHVAPTPIRSRLRRKVAGLPLGVWLVAVLGAGIALAVIVTTLGITGNFTHSVDPEATVEYDSVTVSANGSTDPDCTVSFTADSITIESWDSFAPNAECRLNVSLVKVSGNTAVYLSEFVAADPLLNISMMADTLACHDEITTTPKAFAMRIVATNFDDSEAGTYTASLEAGDGIEFSDSAVEGDCNSAT